MVTVRPHTPCRWCGETGPGPFDSRFGHPVQYFTKLGYEAGVAHPECVVERNIKRFGRKWGEGFFIARDSPYPTKL